MTQSPGLLQDIARFAARAGRFEQLPSEVTEISKEIMVNAAAVGLAGAAQQDGHTVTRFVQEMGGNGKCTIIGKGMRTSPVYATLANGILVHLLDFDEEVSANGSHPGSVVFPVVMALGEMNGIPGKDVLAAFAVGCEVISKLHSLMLAREAQDEQADLNAIPYGGLPETLGAATAAGMLLGLNEERMLQSFQLSCNYEGLDLRAGGAGPIRAYGQGQAAMSGIMAALLVYQGLHAIPGNLGLAHTHLMTSSEGGLLVSAKLANSLGRPFDLVGQGIALKLYPCATQAHTVIDAVLQLVQQYRVTNEDIAAIQIGITPSALAALPYPTPANGWEARACAGFIVASALTFGHPLIDNFTDAAVADARVRNLMDLVTVEPTESPLTSIPYPCSVAVTLKSGRLLRHRVEFARGLAELPLSPEELDAKFLYCSRYILPPDHIEEAVTRLRDLENIDNTTGLFSVLGG